MKKSRFLIFILAGIVVVGGTIYALMPSPANDEPDPTIVVSKEVEKATEINESIDTVEVNGIPTEGQKSGNAPTVTSLPTQRAELESTNPSSVNLASGTIQLVEVFAFW